PHDLATVFVVFENLLTDQLAFAVAVSSKPNSFGGAKRLANGSEFGGFASALCWASAVKSFWPQKYRRPTLPGRHSILWFDQVEQMALGREDITVARTNGGADVFCLAGFLRYDD